MSDPNPPALTEEELAELERLVADRIRLAGENGARYSIGRQPADLFKLNQVAALLSAARERAELVGFVGEHGETLLDGGHVCRHCSIPRCVAFRALLERFGNG